MAEHRIGRQILEIVARDPGVAENLADRASAVASMLAATLARRFDAAEDGRRRRIERLVLTLDASDSDDFEASLLANLDAALGQILPPQLARTVAIDPVEDALDLIALFLRSGMLPWWAADHTALASATETLLIAHAADDPSVVIALRQLLRPTDAATRFVRGLPARILPRLTATLSGLPAEDLDTLAVRLTAEARDANPVVAATRVWAVMVAAAAQGELFQNVGTFGQAARARLARSEELQGEIRSPRTSLPIPAPDTTTLPGDVAPPQRQPDRTPPPPLPPQDPDTPDALFDPPDPSEHLRAIDDTPSRPFDPDADPPAARARTEGPLSAIGSETLPRQIETRPEGILADAVFAPSDRATDRRVPNAERQPAAPIAPPDSVDTRAAASEHDALFIETAGMVLLAPFLRDFFATARLVDAEGRFVTPAAQHRAVLLLDYLASADRNPPEARLALAKLLAGLPIDTVLAPGALDDGEAGAADTLLTAVLAELPMLGQLTENGFRSAWLNRPGLLTVAHGSWLLRIERRAWDVLLGRLPWAIEWLHLPWQPEGIRIEW